MKLYRTSDWLMQGSNVVTFVSSTAILIFFDPWIWSAMAVILSLAMMVTCHALVLWRCRAEESERMLRDRKPGATELGLREFLRWYQQTVHQAHHQGDVAVCRINTCECARKILEAYQ